MSAAVYAGSFDVLTTGHMWMIDQGAKLFDQLIVAIGDNPAKKSMFDAPFRKELIQKSVKEVGHMNVQVHVFSGLYLFEYARACNVNYILRGVRNAEDFEYERVMRNLNGDFAPEIQTVCLMPPREIAEISSSIVKGLIGPEGWEHLVRTFVPAPVFEALNER